MAGAVAAAPPPPPRAVVHEERGRQHHPHPASCGAAAVTVRAAAGRATSAASGRRCATAVWPGPRASPGQPPGRAALVPQGRQPRGCWPDWRTRLGGRCASEALHYAPVREQDTTQVAALGWGCRESALWARESSACLLGRAGRRACGRADRARWGIMTFRSERRWSWRFCSSLLLDRGNGLRDTKAARAPSGLMVSASAPRRASIIAAWRVAPSELRIGVSCVESQPRASRTNESSPSSQKTNTGKNVPLRPSAADRGHSGPASPSADAAALGPSRRSASAWGWTPR